MTTRHSPQVTAAPMDAWPNGPVEETALSDADQWLVDHAYAYSPNATLNATLGEVFLNDATSPRFSFTNFTTHLSDIGLSGATDNALGLDISHSLSPPGFDDANYLTGFPIMNSPFPRQYLPQIVTEGLETTAMTYPHSREHSPYHMTAALSAGGRPPLSAATSTPSSAGYNTIPRTPLSLPPPLNLALPQPNGLLTPHSPYTPYTPFASQLSPKSPSAPLYMPSPGGSSRADFSEDDANNTSSVTGIPITVPTVLELASRFPNADWTIPQKTYRPNTQSDRRRYVEEVALELPIMFFLQHPDGCGLPCRDALTSKFSRLSGRDDPMFKQRGPSVSIRINWPGYAPWSRQIPTRDFRSPPQPITRSKLAKNVAKTIQRFLEDMKDKPMEEDADPRYRVGPQHIRIDHLELIGLQHVSMGSWQAHMRLRRRP